MLSQLTEAMIVNGVVLATVLATDLGPARKIGPLRLLRPVIAAAVIIPLFVDRPVTHGNGLVVEIAGIVAGLLGGLAAAALMGVYRSPETGKPVSRRWGALRDLVDCGHRRQGRLLLRIRALVRGPGGQLGHCEPGQPRGLHGRADLHGDRHDPCAHPRARRARIPPARRHACPAEQLDRTQRQRPPAPSGRPLRCRPPGPDPVAGSDPSVQALEEHVEAARSAELPAAEHRRPRRVEGQVREPPDQDLDRDPDLGAGEGVPGAEVPARTERQVR